ncbi:MAG TPA: hypothetical protein VFK30_00685 [Anaerolineae bacterium]|nr:hypothetical protein [Anaerolineae bacterium]
MDHIIKSEEDATRLMIHHLILAAELFESTHDDQGQRAAQMLVEHEVNEVVTRAALLFIHRLVIDYELMAVDFGDEAVNDNDDGDET